MKLKPPYTDRLAELLACHGETPTRLSPSTRQQVCEVLRGEYPHTHSIRLFRESLVTLKRRECGAEVRDDAPRSAYIDRIRVAIANACAELGYTPRVLMSQKPNSHAMRKLHRKVSHVSPLVTARFVHEQLKRL